MAKWLLNANKGVTGITGTIQKVIHSLHLIHCFPLKALLRFGKRIFVICPYKNRSLCFESKLEF